MSLLSASDVTSEPEIESPDAGDPVVPPLWRRIRPDLLILASYLAVACYVLGRLWRHIDSAVLTHSYADHYVEEWFIGADTHALLGLHNPFFNNFQNTPAGVNMMANTSILGLALPLLPVTVLFGASVSFALAITLGLTGTAFGWYWLLHRELRLRRSAAIIGGAFAAFSPPFISHSNGHANLVALFLIPWIVRLALRLPRSAHPVRHGLWLGLLVVYQVFIGEEPLLMTALALALFVVLYAVQSRGELRAMVRPFLISTATAGAVALVLLAYPLYQQFAGPEHYKGLGDLAGSSNSLRAFTTYPTASLGYERGPLTSLNYAEQNANFGWPVLILAVAVAIWLWRERLVRVCAIVGAVFGACSLGGTVSIHGHKAPGPWRLFQPLPLLGSMTVSRFTFVTAVAIGILLAIATDRVLAAGSGGRPMRAVWIAALAGALVPLLPLPLPANSRPVVPAFFTDGTYRNYVQRGHAIVPVPLVDPGIGSSLSWQVATKMYFTYPDGYFLGPFRPGGMAYYNPPYSTTKRAIQRVIEQNKPITLTDAQRTTIVAELRKWKADAVVIAAYDEPNALKLQFTLDPLLGPAQQVDGVWLWDVRGLTRS